MTDTTNNADSDSSAQDQAADIAPDMSEQTLQQRSAEKDPADWVTGDEPATGAQLSYLSTLAREAGTEAPEAPSKAEASIAIDELQHQTGRD